MKKFKLSLTVLAMSLAAIQAQAVTLTFIENNDLHAHLTPHLDKVVKNGQVVYESRGGLARVATLVKQIRAQNPNSVLMNVGDTYHGGVEALYTLGNAVIDPLNSLGVDVGVPGNWDFAYGPNVLRLRYVNNLTTFQKNLLQATVSITVKKPNFPNLAANMQSTAGANAGGLLLPGTLLKTVGGVKVGFIGLTSDIVAQMDSMLAVGLSFTQGETAYRDLINTQAQSLRSQGAELVMVMSELGLQKDYRLADVISAGAVDVFFSAHTHDTIFTPLKTKSGALVVEAGHDGWLGRMDVDVVSGQTPVFNWTLLPVDSSIPDDPAMKTLVDAARAPFLTANPNMTVPMNGMTLKLTQPINTVLGHVYAPLDREDALESTFNNAWTDTLRQQTGTDIAITPGFRMDAPTPAAGMTYEDNYVADGALTIEDVYRYIPVPYTLGTGTIAGSAIKSILESDLTAVYSLDSFLQGGGWANGWSGLNINVDLSHPDGQRVQSIVHANGSPIADTDTLTATGCLRPTDTADGTGTILCSFSGFSNVKSLINPATGNPWYPQELFTTALTQGWLANGARHNITDAAATPAWPAQPFVQPLAVRVTSGVNMVKSGLTYNVGSQIYTGQITVSNTGTVPHQAPLKLVIEGLTSTATVVNAAGTYYNQPYLTLTGSLAPGSSTTVKVQFKNSSPTRITYSPATYTGGV
ncbi:bifunctional metallophosphatase/5'-nucleotidase [Sulfurirhabdus autotrophica]|uniref:2',3'-cyclic-nucleotide 2'-phosphodiesterase (5'-nucleotidase family) n=1 Tax=Sulfurirhabdus autotrophica TaxID=1706046 RepID=A0A4R3XQE6_9PROT|nr:bifunctional metallophosphatase/5'-nucleotidase [Sulfurirhabdus autotrophica]TCV79023.1 2',3'-cyclic-nucleotide 2'-phosphodiesterase (5'-nucleotidase family) [Sulfurirhabdus autotrophica]